MSRRLFFVHVPVVFLCVGVLALALWFGALGMVRLASHRFPIRRVTVHVAGHHVDEAKLVKRVAGKLQRGFFLADLRALRQQLRLEPWVDTVSVRRVWPDAVSVRVAEKQPIARWNDRALVTQQGEVFAPSAVYLKDFSLQLRGAPGAALKVVAMYEAVQRALGALGIRVTGLALKASGWEIEVNHHLPVRLGESSSVQDKLQRFAVLYERVIRAHEKEAVSVDLRYPNGVAVRWREGVPRG